MTTIDQIKEEEANIAYQEYASVLIFTEEEIATIVCVLGSGELFHVTPYKEYFKKLQIGKFDNTFLANNRYYNIISKGDKSLNLKNGNSWLLRNVRYVL